MGWSVQALLSVGILYVPAFLICGASVLYAKRVRTPPSAALAVGAIGQLVAGLSSLRYRIFALPSHPPTADSLPMSSILGYVGLAFSLLFAVSLLLVLRGAARDSGSVATLGSMGEAEQQSIDELPV